MSDTIACYLQDIFRRADKNDDNHISMDEWMSFFQDAVMDRSEMEELFAEIDTHKTGTIEVEELLRYFQADLEPESVTLFESLQGLGRQLAPVLGKCQQSYAGMDHFKKYKARFWMNRMVSQLGSVQTQLQTAIDSLESEAEKTRPASDKPAAVPEPLRLSRSASRKAAEQSFGRELDAARAEASPVAVSADLQEQVDRLKGFMNALEITRLPGMPAENAAGEPFNMTHKEFIFVAEEMSVVVTGVTPELQGLLDTYSTKGCSFPGCYHMWTTNLPGKACVYGIWHQASWLKQQLNPIYQEFFDRAKKHLDGPITTKTLKFGQDTFH